MEGWQLSILIEAYSINAEIEGMKALNAQRLSEDKSIAYDEQAFNDMSIELLRLSRDIK